MEWKHIAWPTQQKFKRTISTCKYMQSIYGDRKQVISVEFIRKKQTFNSAAQSIKLKKLRRAIHSKGCVLFSNGVILSHNNARSPHAARVIKDLVESCERKDKNHPHYNLGPPPDEFHLLLYLKYFMSCQRFDDDEGLKDAVTTIQSAIFYDDSIQNVVQELSAASWL